MGDFLLFFTCSYKRIEHWVTGVGTGLKFRVKLPRHKEWMIFQFNHFW